MEEVSTLALCVKVSTMGQSSEQGILHFLVSLIIFLLLLTSRDREEQGW